MCLVSHERRENALDNEAYGYPFYWDTLYNHGLFNSYPVISYHLNSFCRHLLIQS